MSDERITPSVPPDGRKRRGFEDEAARIESEAALAKEGSFE